MDAQMSERMHIKNVKLAARIADHMRQIGGTHADTIRIIIKKGLAADAGGADALLYDADMVMADRMGGRGAL